MGCGTSQGDINPEPGVLRTGMDVLCQRSGQFFPAKILDINGPEVVVKWRDGKTSNHTHKDLKHMQNIISPDVRLDAGMTVECFHRPSGMHLPCVITHIAGTPNSMFYQVQWHNGSQDDMGNHPRAHISKVISANIDTSVINTVGLQTSTWNKEECKQIFNAAKHGRLAELRQYINSGGPIDCTPFGSQTPLYISAFYGKVDCLNFLAEKGANLNTTEKDGFTPAHAAASQGQLAALQALALHGADIMKATTKGSTTMSLAQNSNHSQITDWLMANYPLFRGEEPSKSKQKQIFNAAKHGRLQELKSLIEAGGPVDCTPFGSQTPAYIAAFYGKVDCLNYLASKGADLNKVEKQGFTAAHAAASEGRLEALKALHRLGANLEGSTKGGSTCYSLAKNSKKQHVIDFLTSTFPKFRALASEKWGIDEQKKIFNAAKHGRLGELKGYVEDGGPIECTPFGSQTPLYIAAFYGKLNCLQYLASKGAELNCVEKDGFTPAHAASSEGRIGCLQELHKLGADLSKATGKKQTCMSLAKNANHSHIVEFLANNVEAFSNFSDKYWNAAKIVTVLEACRDGYLDPVKKAIDDGMSADCIASSSAFGDKTPAYIAAANGRLNILSFLGKSGADLSRACTEPKMNSVQMMPCHIAVIEGQFECLEYLHNMGADLTIPASDGRDCMTMARSGSINNPRIAEFLRNQVVNSYRARRSWKIDELKKVFNAAKHGRLEELRNYLDQGAPIDCTPFGSQTPAYIASFYGKLQCIKLLTARGANLNKVEKDGYTPAHAASSEGKLDTLKWLHQNGADLNFMTDSGQTCMSLAQKAGHTNIVKWIETTLNPPQAQINLVSQLQDIMTMKNEGLLSEMEFQAAKAKLLGINEHSVPNQVEGFVSEGAAPTAPPSYGDAMGHVPAPGYDGPGFNAVANQQGEAPPAYDDAW